MKKEVIIIFSILFLILFINGCSKGQIQETVEQSEEAIEPEQMIEEVKEEVSEKPEVAEVQEEAKVPDTCGNNKCEPEERCDEQTHTTICRVDCNLQCEAFLTFHEEGKNQEENNLKCFEALNCEERGDNKFKIKGDTKLIMVVENFGEKISSPISSDFHCNKGSSSIATNDNDESSGIKFSDSFEGKESISLSGKYKEDNKIDYEFKMEYINLTKTFDADCSISISSSKHGSKVEFIDLSFL